MSRFQGMAGLGAGMMQGLELARRHRFEDEEADQRRRGIEQRTQAHDLSMRVGEQGLNFNEQMNPIRMQSAQNQAEMGGMQLADMRHAMPYQQRGRERQDQMQGLESVRAQAAHFAPMALQQLQSGDMDGVSEYLSTAYQQPIQLERSEDGRIVGFTQQGDELLEREFSPAEIQQLIRGAAGIAEPEDSADWRRLNDGALYNQRTGQIMGDDGAGLPMGAGTGKGGALTSSDYSLMERVSSRFWGTLNADGQFIMEPGSEQNYNLSLHRAGELARAGIPVTEATYLANMSIKGPVDEAEAARMAEQEAREQGLSRRERSAYINQRAPEIMDESREAQRVYESIVGGNGPGMGRTGMPGPGAGGGQGLPQAGGMQPPAGRGGLSLPDVVDPLTGREIGAGGGMQSAPAPASRQPPAGLIAPDGMRDSDAARAGRRAREGVAVAADAASRGMDAGLDASRTMADRSPFAIYGHAPRAIYGAGRNIVSAARDFFSPGIDPSSVPPAVTEASQVVAEGGMPSRDQVIEIMRWAEQTGGAGLSDEAIDYLSDISHQYGL